MSLFRYDPFHDFDRLFDHPFFQGALEFNNARCRIEGGDGAACAFRPRMDLHENTENNTVTATLELPGLKKEDINIDIHNGRLTISAENKQSTEHEEKGYTVRERRFGKFSRTLQLPQGIKEEEIKATMEDGILTITFPKTTPEMAPKRISVTSKL